MGKLRKTLGDVNAPCTIALKALIDTQSKETIRKWCLDYAENSVLPVFERLCPEDCRPRNAIAAARAYLDGRVKFTVVREIILNQCHAAAREFGESPTAQVAARAIGQGAAVHVPTHALGLYFYAAAAAAYDRAGPDASHEVYLPNRRENLPGLYRRAARRGCGE